MERGKRIPLHDHANLNSGGRIDNIVQQVVSTIVSGGGGGASDHGSLGGLDSDSHGIYARNRHGGQDEIGRAHV